MLHAIGEKTRAYRKWCKSRLDQDYIFYRKKRNYATKVSRDSTGIKTFEKDISIKIEENPNKNFGSNVKSKTRFQHKVADLVIENGTACTLDNEKAEKLSDTFANLFTVVTKNDLILELPTFPLSYFLDVSDNSQELMLIKCCGHNAWGPNDINLHL